jgi:hypothetical protein
MRALVLSAVALGFPGPARAAIMPSFSVAECNPNATHVVVVDSTGKVLESWRGGLRPGDSVPLKEFRITLGREIVEGILGKPTGERVTGDRLVLFLRNTRPIYYDGQTAGGWSPAHWCGWFNVSTVWVENGRTYSLGQRINPGPLVMSLMGTEDELRKAVVGLNEKVREQLAKAREEKDLAARARLLAEVANRTTGFAAAAFAGLEWCGADALPALRGLLRNEFLPDSERAATFRTMAVIGLAARDDLVRELDTQLGSWKNLSRRVEYAEGLGTMEDPIYQTLLAATSNPAAFADLTDAQRRTVRELRDFWAAHPVLSKLGDPGDRVTDRLDRVLGGRKP